MATRTGGAYFLADNTTALQTVFENIALDLRGQWNLAYITPRNSGAATVTIEFSWEESRATHETTIDASQLNGDIHAGIIEAQGRLYDAATDTTSFPLVARYVPRNVDRFRFFIPKSGAALELQGAGGLTDPADGWTLSDLGGGVWQVFGFDALEYGAFGNIGIVTIVTSLLLTFVNAQSFGLRLALVVIGVGGLVLLVNTPWVDRRELVLEWRRSRRVPQTDPQNCSDAVGGRDAGHVFDQQRMKQPLYRHPWDDILYL